MSIAALHDFTQDDVTRALPHAVQCEKSLLSSIIQDPADVLPIAHELGLSAGHFYMPAHSILFGFLTELYEAGIEIELVTLVQRLLDRGLLDKVGGPAGLTEIYTFAPAFGHFRAHAKHVSDKFTLRSIIHASNDAIASAYDAPEEVSELLDKCEANILAIRGSQGIVGEKNTPDTVKEIVQEINDRIKGKGTQPGLSTGFQDLDRLGADIQPGEVMLVAARPGMGKTSWLMNVIERNAVDLGIPCGVFSVEMKKKQILSRVVMGRAKVNPLDIERGVFPDMDEKLRIAEAARQVANSPLYVDDTPSITITQLRAKARRWKKDHGIRMIGIDYAGLIKSTSKQAQGSREREMSEISAGIKGLAKELDLSVILLAQLNRAGENRTGKDVGKPRMSDLRDSGSLEQDADMVGLLYRPEYYAETQEAKTANKGRAEMNLAKNRGGQTGIVPLVYIAEFTRFESGSPYQEPVQPSTGRTYEED